VNQDRSSAGVASCVGGVGVAMVCGRGGSFPVIKNPGCAEVQQNFNGNVAVMALANELKGVKS